MESRGGLAKTPLPELRAVLFAGEVFPLPVLRRLLTALPQAPFYNLFGPTETNVCLCYQVARDLPQSWSTLPIGRPIAGVECFALNEENNPVKAGEEGELWVRGPTVMLGYLQDDARTRDVVTVPPGGKEVAYRTGDIVSHDAAGVWNFVGRKDTQVKSRGYRIDLREIEAAVYQSGKVVECAVVAVPNGILGFDFVAYAVAAEGATERDLLAHCRGLLPDYMLPRSIEFCAALPKTTTGKLDYRALAKSTGLKGMEPPVSIRDRVHRYIIEDLKWPDDPSVLTDDFSLIEGRVLDSIRVLSLVQFLESEYGIEVLDTEITSQHLDTLARIEKYVNMKRAPQGQGAE
jgi:acyl-coenzyme A synthetase/AMP-(fatty) acid ligase/acyl carrier protein